MKERKQPFGWYAPDRYEIQQKIGFGSYGSVCEAYDHVAKRVVAIKRQRNVFRDLSDTKRMLREIAILARLSHGNVVRLYDIYVDGDDPADFDDLYCVMEALSTDLRHFLKRDIHLEPTGINTLAYHMFVGLKYLHSAGIYHRDLKPANCLLNEDLTLKLCDFGLARPVVAEDVGEHRPSAFYEETLDTASFGSSLASCDWDSESSTTTVARRMRKTLTGHVVTRWYRAPELILLQPNYTEKVDVWSAGCIYAELLELLPDGPPLKDRTPVFPGTRCEPLSPDFEQGDAETNAQFEQLSHIFRVLGTPAKEDIDSLEGESSKRYAMSFGRSSGIGLHNLFQYATADSRDMLEKLLVFTPTARISVDEALEHGIFAGIRDPCMEMVAPNQIELDFENDDASDLAFFEGAFDREISCFQSQRRTCEAVRGSTGTPHATSMPSIASLLSPQGPSGVTCTEDCWRGLVRSLRIWCLTAFSRRTHAAGSRGCQTVASKMDTAETSLVRWSDSIVGG